MKCPYCNQEMSEGYIYNASQPVQWLPKGTMPARISFTSKEEGISLKNKFKLFKESGYTAEAFYCYQCRTVLAQAE